MIIRSSHDRTDPYFRMRRLTAQNSELSWAARGLLAYLISKPDGWEVSLVDIIAQGDLKRDAIRKILRELEAAGHLLRRRERHPESGLFHWISEIYESPMEPAIDDNGHRPGLPPVEPDAHKSFKTPSTDFPPMDDAKSFKHPSTCLPSTDDPSTVNTSIHIEENLEKRELREERETPLGGGGSVLRARARADGKAAEPPPPPGGEVSDEDFMAAQAMVFPDLDVWVVHAKMVRWCQPRKLTPTRERLVQFLQTEHREMKAPPRKEETYDVVESAKARLLSRQATRGN